MTYMNTLKLLGLARHIHRKWHADVAIASRKHVKNDSYGGIIGDSMAVSMLKMIVTAALSAIVWP